MTTSLPVLYAVPQGDGEQWILIVVWGLGLLSALIALLLVVARLARDLGSVGGVSEHVARLEAAVKALAEREEGLDLRRLEHVLIDIRDAHKRLDERLMGMTESIVAAGVNGSSEAETRGHSLRVSERVIGRLLALGYERIEIVTPFEEFDGILVDDGEMAVEARKGGALYKGRVIFRDGAIADVKLRSGHEAYP